MNFFKSFSITFTTTILLTFFGIANNIIITRQIGVEGRGQYAVIMNFVLLLSLLLGEGIRRSSIILVGSNKNYLQDLVKKSFYYAIIVLFLLFAIFFSNDFFSSLLPNISANLLAISLLSISLYIFWQSIQALFLGIQKIVFFNILQVSTVTFNLVFNIVGVYLFNFGLFEIIAIYLISTILTVFIAFIGINNSIKELKVTYLKAAVSKLLNLGSRSLISGLFSFAILRSGVFFSNYYLDIAQTGLYSIAFLFFEILSKLPNTIGTLVLSRTAIDSSNSNSENTAKLVRAMMFIDFLFIIGFIILGKFIVILAFGNEFAGSVILIMYLFPAFLFIGPSSVLHAFFMGKGYPNKVIILNGISALITFILLYIFISDYGIISVSAITSLIISGWTLTLMIFFILDTKISIHKLFFLTKSDVQYLTSSIKSFLKVK